MLFAVEKQAHHPTEVCQVAQDHPGRGIWTAGAISSQSANIPIDGGVIREMGVSINYFLLSIHSLHWILAPLMN